MNIEAVRTRTDRLRDTARTCSVWLVIVTLAWSPFPLGGAIAWAAGLQEMAIALCWMLWFGASIGADGNEWRGDRIILIPLVLAFLVLGWAVTQILPIVPASWIHPIWGMASDAMTRPAQGVISLNPWATEAEVLKLASSVMACWLAFRMARQAETAKLLFNALIVIGALYVLFSIVLALSSLQATDLFYSTPHLSGNFSGTFVSRNNFATLMGMICIAATARLFSMGSETIVAGRGLRRLAASMIEHCFGRGAPLLVAAILCFAAVVASASRAGFASTMCGLAVLALASAIIAKHRSSRGCAGAGAIAVLLPLLVLLAYNGDSLGNRLNSLFDTGTADAVRLTLWDAASRMVRDAPWLGLGLGTFQDAYPLYAKQVLPYIMDHAHNDYLEFAAGLGLAAATVWWLAIAWLFGLCIRGIRARRRSRHYCVTAVATTVLIAVHSCFDFSLQIPAVALFYAVLLGVGTAQSLSTRAL